MNAAKAALELARGIRRRRGFERGVRILTYHGVVDRVVDRRVEDSFHTVADFRAHVALLRRCAVVRLEELEPALTVPRRWPAVAITFDDGFRNNLIAAELLAAAKLPATVFLATDNVRSGQPIWPTVLRLILARGSARTLVLAGESFDLDQDPAAFDRARTLFKRATTEERAPLWSSLLAHLGTDELPELVAGFPSIAMLAPKEVAQLLAAGIDLGSHGALHELHHERQPPALRRHELVASKHHVEQLAQRECALFAFPNGATCSDSADEARAAGYRYAFTMVSHAASYLDDRMLLPRLMPGGSAEKLSAKLVFGN